MNKINFLGINKNGLKLIKFIILSTTVTILFSYSQSNKIYYGQHSGLSDPITKLLGNKKEKKKKSK